MLKNPSTFYVTKKLSKFCFNRQHGPFYSAPLSSVSMYNIKEECNNNIIISIFLDSLHQLSTLLHLLYTMLCGTLINMEHYRISPDKYIKLILMK